MHVLGFTCEKGLISEDKLREKIAPILKEFQIDVENAYEAMDKILEIRAKARAEKNWDLSDKIRNEFDKIGIIFNDGKEKSVWCEK